MDFTIVWETILIFSIGTIILKISGRKSISQMTIPQTVIMIAIGSLLIQPVTGRGLFPTFIVAFILVLCLVITEYIQLKNNATETAISGKAISVIENGHLNEKNLHKLRLPVDQLEARLRQEGIISINDVQYATIETSGQLGYTLKPEKQPATKEDIQNLIQLIQYGKFNENPLNNNNIFTETLDSQKKQMKHPNHLQ
ncbi:hypothetical protein CD30_08655 [Ureibacillus massiliensis 4400831 = CIP 108448 = CCUG 49529]|uniref:YetF C-terminal domain-containing protein n=1 Tax=Ureibacillus massiliensis 4400831 = CIP 108448 = CCUG 49529 TaxID=1211035 RepID=A0A0A3J703_9BACL|nr:DUF421 domain-containing protein [Ureibacillus massiliensis]KGR90953.1 hypothetical protein CD30_08655 [Ureibacillus massiliensis 4400831 = CIP 108448 = CCUG 49529]